MSCNTCQLCMGHHKFVSLPYLQCFSIHVPLQRRHWVLQPQIVHVVGCGGFCFCQQMHKTFMTISMKTNLRYWSNLEQMMCIELRAKKLWNVYHSAVNVCACEMYRTHRNNDAMGEGGGLRCFGCSSTPFALGLVDIVHRTASSSIFSYSKPSTTYPKSLAKFRTHSLWLFELWPFCFISGCG